MHELSRIIIASQFCWHSFSSGERNITPFYCHTFWILIVFVVVVIFPFGSENSHIIVLVSSFVFNREGRTETVRPCTMASCAFVRTMLNPSSTVSNIFVKLHINCYALRTLSVFVTACHELKTSGSLFFTVRLQRFNFTVRNKSYTLCISSGTEI